MNRAHLKLLALWDSNEELAKAVGTNAVAIRKWRQRERIPPEYWDVIAETDKAVRSGITLKMLAERPRKSRKPRKADQQGAAA